MRSEDVIQREKESAKETADNMSEEEPLNSLVAQTVYKTLMWVDGEGEECLDDELLKMNDENENE